MTYYILSNPTNLEICEVQAFSTLAEAQRVFVDDEYDISGGVLVAPVAQPVDRVAAMATLLTTNQHPFNIQLCSYTVPDKNGFYAIDRYDKTFTCNCHVPNCLHIKAVKIYLTQQEHDK